MQAQNSISPDLAALQKSAGLTITSLALQSGVSKGTVSKIMAGNYNQDSDAWRKVHKTLSAAVGMKSNHAPGFASRGQKLMYAILEATVEDREFTIITGASGLGKTHTIKRFVSEHPGTIALEANLSMSTRDMYRHIARGYGVGISGTMQEIENRVLAECSNRVLIVDEADMFVAGRKSAQAQRMLDIYRQISESGGTVILIGLIELHHAIIKMGETYLTSRIGYYRHVDDPTVVELGDFWESHMAAYPQAAAKAGPIAAQSRRFGNFRYLKKLASRTKRMDGDVEEAVSLLFRPEA